MAIGSVLCSIDNLRFSQILLSMASLLPMTGTLGTRLAAHLLRVPLR
jgi:hypothetical protein